MNNKKLGTSFEHTVCKLFADEGFWVHFFSPDIRGTQPFDVIAVKDGFATAIECKTLADTENFFRISRLEVNQLMAFEKWLACGNIEPQIAVLWKGQIYLIGYNELKEKSKIDMRKLVKNESDCE